MASPSILLTGRTRLQRAEIAENRTPCRHSLMAVRWQSDGSLTPIRVQNGRAAARSGTRGQSRLQAGNVGGSLAYLEFRAGEVLAEGLGAAAQMRGEEGLGDGTKGDAILR